MNASSADAEDFGGAFAALVRRLQAGFGDAKLAEPVRMYVAGGCAVHHYTGWRVSEDVDATFSHRFPLPRDLEVVWDDGTGPRILYLDTNYNDTFALMHEDYQADAVEGKLSGVDPARIRVFFLSPVDLAVSKISRFGPRDQDDIAALARAGLIDAAAVEARANEALGGYVGNLDSLRTSIMLAIRLIEQHRPAAPQA